VLKSLGAEPKVLNRIRDVTSRGAQAAAPARSVPGGRLRFSPEVFVAAWTLGFLRYLNTFGTSRPAIVDDALPPSPSSMLRNATWLNSRSTRCAAREIEGASTLSR